MNNLENIVKDNAKSYYTTGTQNISDETFDALIEKIEEENPNSSVLTTGWGYEVDENGKVKHVYGKIKGLKKAHNWDEITSILKTKNLKNVDVSAKLDGMSVVLYYELGQLDKAITRGNGEYGRDITDKVRLLIGDSISDENFSGAVRGEIMMCPADFELYKKNICPEAENARNTAAGLINGDDTSNYGYLKLYVYSLVADQVFTTKDKYSPYIHNIKYWLKDNYEHCTPRITLDLTESDYESELLTLKLDWEQNLTIDGVVISLDSLTVSPNGEITADACAYKFEDETKISTIIGIEWISSKYGTYVPVALIDPIRLEGTTVKRVSLYNAQRVVDLGIEIGSIVAVCKRNQIIPYIKEVVR